STAAYLNRGNARAHAGDRGGAISDYTRALEIEGKMQAAYLNRGSLLTLEGKLADALRDLDAAQRLSPRDPAVYRHRGYLRRRLGDLDGAMADFDRALQLEPDNPETHNRRAITLRAKGDPVAALAGFDRALKLNPRNYEALGNRGATRASMADFAGAVSDYDRAIKLEPGKWNAWALRAVACYALAQPEEFKRSLERAQELHGDRERIRKFVETSGRGARALAEGKALEGKELTTAGQHYRRGSYRYSARLLEGARSDFEAAVRLDASLGPRGVFTVLATIAGMRKKHDEKMKVYRKWAAVAPEDPVALNALAWELLTSADHKLRDPAAALPLAVKAAELSKEKSPQILDTLAAARFANGKLTEAVKAAEKALGLLPAGTPPHERRAYSRRLERYRQALDPDPKSFR
ncbi:MAG: tetratricopeptide repeat protein, partial [Planctomycetota bacterium]